MNSYERVIAVLEGKKDEVDQIPCVNTVSTATVEFMEKEDAYWPDAHKDPEKMARLGAAAHKYCGLDNITIPFDMTVEAEVFGTPIDFREKAAKKGRYLWPGSKRHVAESPEMIYIPDDIANTKRVPVISKAIKILKEEYGGKAAVNVFMVPPFTGLSSYIVDTIKFMMAMKSDPDLVGRFMETLTPPFIEIANAYVDAGVDMITLHDMGAPCDNISQEQFVQFVKPYLTKIIAEIDVPVVLNICGKTEPIIGDMVECGANAIAVDEKDSIANVRASADAVTPGYPIIGNLAPKSVIHQAPIEVIKEQVKAVIDQGIDMVAPGCDFWIQTPSEKIKAMVDATAEFGKK
ncbi:MAG: methylcobamide:CoM methyltransferase [Candidatus Syntrophoarchaeum caldarius]|uniref:Methylcobamide:CoM methyltransferase n=1 Tax=Candidatus Syntropharchaeum caldarium TaxID=1838285 RepID=A0A1F2P7E6_9EURY|nr:MAG: methylcobamide:CoM methyltransferase [Candidatus Syntrophoarchaeum caldarius]